MTCCISNRGGGGGGVVQISCSNDWKEEEKAPIIRTGHMYTRYIMKQQSSTKSQPYVARLRRHLLGGVVLQFPHPVRVDRRLSEHADLRLDAHLSRTMRKRPKKGRRRWGGTHTACVIARADSRTHIIHTFFLFSILFSS